MIPIRVGGSCVEDKACVVLTVPPSIEPPPQPEYRAVQRQEIVLPCRASGVPNPRVHWEKDDQPIKPNDFRYRVMRSGWLTIPLARFVLFVEAARRIRLRN